MKQNKTNQKKKKERKKEERRVKPLVPVHNFS